MPASTYILPNPHNHLRVRKLRHRERKSFRHPLVTDQQFKQTLQLVSFTFPFRSSFPFSLSLLFSHSSSLKPHPPPTSLLYWNPYSLLLPTALFTLCTEHPRENTFPKKTNVPEPAVGAGDSEPSTNDSAPNSGKGRRDGGWRRLRPSPSALNPQGQVRFAVPHLHFQTTLTTEFYIV